MFILTRLFLVALFVKEEGEGQETPRDPNTPQEETNEFQVII
jgi:hypothetical protein